MRTLSVVAECQYFIWTVGFRHRSCCLSDSWMRLWKKIADSITLGMLKFISLSIPSQEASFCSHPWKTRRSKTWTTGSRMSNTQKDNDTAGRQSLVLGFCEMSLKHGFSSPEAKHQLCPSLSNNYCHCRAKLINISLKNLPPSYPVWEENYIKYKKVK